MFGVGAGGVAAVRAADCDVISGRGEGGDAGVSQGCGSGTGMGADSTGREELVGGPEGWGIVEASVGI